MGLGSNLGNRITFLKRAALLLEQTIGDINKVSSVYWSAPWGNQLLRPFLNAVLLLETNLSPEELLKATETIEQHLGRKSGKGKWQNRTIDIDLLYFNKDTIHCPGLTIPHPGIEERRFVLQPLVEISPDILHPKLKKTNRELLLECNDHLAVHKWAKF